MSSIVALAAVALLALYLIGVYNRLIRLVAQSEEAWADIDVQLKRRYDLIPNLVETVKGYASHEQGTLDKVIQARNTAMNAGGSLSAQAGAQNAITDALKSVFALSEAYPDLKANQNFLELQRELSDTENKIQAARRFYNGNVRDLAIGIKTFPSSVVAGMFNFKPREYFLIAEGSVEKEPVKVAF